MKTCENLKEIGNREVNINKKYYKNGFFTYHAEQSCQPKSAEMPRLLNGVLRLDVKYIIARFS